jgi:DNA polymerase V
VSVASDSMINKIFQFYYEYQKVDVILTDLVPEGFEQENLFTSGVDQHLAVLYKTINKLNRRRDQIRLALRL